MKCAIRGCGSYAINHHSYERDGSDPDLCDVHYWQKRATLAEVVRARIQPGQYAHIVPDGNRLTVEIGPKPEPPELYSPEFRASKDLRSFLPETELQAKCLSGCSKEENLMK